MPTISDLSPEYTGKSQGNEDIVGPTNRQQDTPSSLFATSTGTDEDEEIVVTSIRATHISLGLRRLPAGFYAMVQHSGQEWKTKNESSSANDDAAEWSCSIPLPSDVSVTVYFEVYASFEFQPMLGTGEQLRKLTTTTEQLVDHSINNVPFAFFQRDEDIVSPCSSLLIIVKRQKCESNDSLASKNLSSHRSGTEPRSDLEDATNRGHRALSRYQKHGERRDLQRCIQQFEQALNVCPMNHPCRAAAQSNLAMAKFILCQVGDTNASTEVPLSLYRMALAARPVGHADRPSTLIRLAMIHLMRFEKQGDNAERVWAAALLHAARDLSSAESHENRAATFILQLHAGLRMDPVPWNTQSSMGQHLTSHLTDEDLRILSTRLLYRFEQSSDLADLQRAVTILEELVRSTPIGDHRYYAALGNLGVALWYRFKRLGELSDLEGAISAIRATVSLTPDGYHHKPALFNNLGLTLRARFSRLGEPNDLEVAISMFRDAIVLAPRMPDYLSNLGSALVTRFEHFRELSDIDAAISTLRNAVDLSPRYHPEKPNSLNKLGSSLFVRFTHTGELRDLQAAISALRDAVNLTPRGHPHRYTCLSNLGSALKAHFERIGELSDLNNAISTLGEAFDLVPRGHPHVPILLNNLGNCFTIRFKHLGELSDLEEAISRQRDAVDLIPHDDNDHRPGFLNNLGNSFYARFERLEEPNDLEAAISLLKDAVQLTPHGHPDRASHLNSLGRCFCTRFERFGDLSNSEAAITILSESVHLIPHGHPVEPSCLSNLGSSFKVRFHRLAELSDLEVAISRYKDAVDRTPLGHPDKPGHLHKLGDSFFVRFQRIGELSDLENAILTLRGATDLTPHGHLRVPKLLKCLGNALFARFRRLGELDDLDAAILAFRDTVDLTPLDHLQKLGTLNNLGLSLIARFQHLGELSDLEAAISMLRDTVGLTPCGDPDKPTFLSTLGHSLFTRFERLGELCDLESSISTLRNALDLTPQGDPERPIHLSNLGTSFSARYKRLGELSDLEDAISTTKEAVEFTPRDHPRISTLLINLGGFFSARFERLGEISDLELAISVLEDSARVTPPDHPRKPVSLNNLGHSFKVRFDRLGELSDIEAAISTFRDALHLIPYDHPDRPISLNSLGGSLSTRFEHFGNLSDIETAISTLREAADLIPHDHPEKPTVLNNLGLTLLARFGHLRELQDVEAAISTLRDVINISPHGHSQTPGYLNNLGSALKSRFDAIGELSDLEAAIASLNSALPLILHGHPDKIGILNNLGEFLLSRFKRLGGLGDIEGAISTLTEAANLAPHGHPVMAMILTNLGLSLNARFGRLKELHDLEDAISRHMDAIDLSPSGHSHKPGRLSNLGDSFQIRFEHLGEPGDIEQAIRLYSDAASTPVGLTSTRFYASQQWISCARRIHHHSLLHAYSIAIGLLPELAWIGLSLTHRYAQLLHGADVVREAAAAALDSGLLETAVEWLEQGRSIVWGDLFQLRSSYEELESAHPGHARRLCELSSSLEHAGTCREKSSSALWEQTQRAAQEPSAPLKDVATDEKSFSAFLQQSQGATTRAEESAQQEADKHRTLAIERDKLLQEIRRLPGFERFLLRKQFSQLRASAHSGPVVILNAAGNRCDALIVLANIDHVIHVPLPNFTFERSADLHHILKRFLRRACSMEREGKRVTLDDVSWESFLSPLWKCVVKPVLDALALSTPGDLSRIFWCPTGPFVFLPIHAAGFYDIECSQLGNKVFDFVVSSYVPTLSILAPSPSPAVIPSSDLRLLTVRQPPSDGLSRLPGVATELEQIKEIIRNSPLACTGLLESSFGTVEEVLNLMQEADWVHFACHGIQDTANPTNSGLCLADGRRLKLRDIIALSRPRGGLAFLSACQTATGDEGLSDEAIHIAAGMLFAGYGGVIGTMWSISDSLAPEVARDVYEQLFQNGTRPDYRKAARALHDAIGRVRESGRTSFVEWVPFIHVGL